MKRIALFILMLCSGIAIYSQHTVNRFNDRLNDRIPYANMKVTFISVTEKAGNDSVNLTPIQFTNNVGISISNDSITIGKPINTNAWVGDQIIIIAKGSSGKKVKFNTSYWKTSATSYTTSTKGYVTFKFYFDGTYWVQLSSQIL